ncbi:hypothetical protein FS935_11720 [Metabacillus litoralis]|uniref:Uncharacterized protein n=1 Tax=Metabacillus litoralis TaxID=152268 RepID=A0A5C6VZW3_9BACI|nr:hypothetical protein FS935_11720 [Metabacillus litoralis]
MNNTKKIYFIGYFILYPIIFLISFFTWMYFIKDNKLFTVIQDCLAILGIYYLMTSFLFLWYLPKQNKEK